MCSYFFIEVRKEWTFDASTLFHSSEKLGYHEGYKEGKLRGWMEGYESGLQQGKLVGNEVM